jgi:phosphoglycerate dehydrogenase-like enzyme
MLGVDRSCKKTLVAALQQGKLRATLDVCNGTFADFIPLWEMENVLLSPPQHGPEAAAIHAEPQSSCRRESASGLFILLNEVDALAGY